MQWSRSDPCRTPGPAALHPSSDVICGFPAPSAPQGCPCPSRPLPVVGAELEEASLAPRVAQKRLGFVSWWLGVSKEVWWALAQPPTWGETTSLPSQMGTRSFFPTSPSHCWGHRAPLNPTSIGPALLRCWHRMVWIRGARRSTPLHFEVPRGAEPLVQEWSGVGSPISEVKEELGSSTTEREVEALLPPRGRGAEWWMGIGAAMAWWEQEMCLQHTALSLHQLSAGCLGGGCTKPWSPPGEEKPVGSSLPFLPFRLLGGGRWPWVPTGGGCWSRVPWGEGCWL